MTGMASARKAAAIRLSAAPIFLPAGAMARAALGNRSTGCEPDPIWLEEELARTPNGLIYDAIDRCDDGEGALFEGMPCSGDSREGSASFRSAAPRSLHAGGVNTAFLDGHVQFLQEGVDPRVMTYLVYIQDGSVFEKP